MQTKVIEQYLYQQYQDDLDLKAFVDAFNTIAQTYIDWANQIGLPIYTGLSGALLDWVGAGIYGLQRPIIGAPSGAVYNTFAYNTQKYGTGSVATVVASDDVYKRMLTWKLYRGDGFYVNMEWLKRRMKRFLVGRDGAAPAISETSEISILLGANNIMQVIISYPSDQASVGLLLEYLNSGALDLPLQYTINARSA